jgi:hypothetical protein
LGSGLLFTLIISISHYENYVLGIDLWCAKALAWGTTTFLSIQPNFVIFFDVLLMA